MTDHRFRRPGIASRQHTLIEPVPSQDVSRYPAIDPYRPSRVPSVANRALSLVVQAFVWGMVFGAGVIIAAWWITGEGPGLR